MAQLNSLVPPHYHPEADQSSVLRLGLLPLQMADWLWIDDDFAQFNDHKRQQAANHLHKVSAALDQSQAAQQEFTSFLLAHLQTLAEYELNVTNSELIHLPSGRRWPVPGEDLWHSCLWIPEDICLLETDGSDYLLTAASLCSPSNWKLEEKMGRSVDWIHAPVPGYQEQLATRVNKLLLGLKPGKPLLRYNWSIQQGNELCWRDDVESVKKGHPAPWYWRVERQTLVKLPATGAVVFGIRLFLHSFETMRRYCEFEATLRQILEQQSPQMLAYKGIDDSLVATLAKGAPCESSADLSRA